MGNYKIIGTGTYLPKYVLDNKKLEEMVDTSNEWIMTRTGIKKRCISTGEPTWYMAFEAAKEAIKNSGLKNEEIDLVLVSTVTPDYYFPSISCILQGKLNLINAICMDINAACSGFIYCLDIAEKYLKGGEYKNILIVSSEMLSKVTDYTDRSTCVLFGDGAGACVVTNQSTGKFLSVCLGADGTGGSYLYSRALNVENPFINNENYKEFMLFPESKDQFLTMNGQEVFKFATRAMVEACNSVIKKANFTISDIDFIIPHQANTRIIDYAVKKLGIEESKVINILEDFGNTSSSSIPIALDILVKSKRIKDKDKIIFTGFGAGLTYGAVLIEF